MEAMVVCKKAIKSNPDDIRGPLLLTRIYAVQNKFAKAQKILHGVLEKNPQNEVAKEMLEKLDAIKKQLHKTESTNVKSLLRSMPSLDLPANLRAQAAAELDESTSLDVPQKSPYATSNQALQADASRHTTQALEPEQSLEASITPQAESLETLKQQAEAQVSPDELEDSTSKNNTPQTAQSEFPRYTPEPKPEASAPVQAVRKETPAPQPRNEKIHVSPFKLILSLKWFPVLASLCVVVLLDLGIQHLRKK